MSLKKNANGASQINDENEKPCRACMDFRSWMKLNRNVINKESNSKVKNSGEEASNAIQNFTIPIEAEYGGRGTAKKSSTAANYSEASLDEESYPKWGSALKYGCPADSLSLGRGTWRMLHTMAAYYPESPSNDVKENMKKFIDLFSHFYPCKPCADDFREWIKVYPPDVSSTASLSRWFCNAHNDVNRKLGKSEFNCDLVQQRWSDGWKDGSCD